MRIGVDATLLYGRYSGVEYAIHHLLRELAAVDQENEYVVYVDRDFIPAEDFPPKFHWKHTSFRGSQRLRRILWQQMVLPSCVRKDALDIFHGPGYVIPLRSPAPCIVTVYDIIALTHPELCRLGNRLHYGFVLPRALHRAARVIVPSECVQEEIVRKFPTLGDRIRVVPLGVNPAFFVPPSADRIAHVRAGYHLPERYLLFVGNLEAKKNLPLLVRAFRQMRMACPSPHHLVLVGCARRMPVGLMEAIEYPELRDCVHVLDYVPEEDLPCIYAGAELFVLPSLIEGFGLPALESMALGTPVVASRAGALPEVIGDAGMLCDPTDVDSVASALLRLVSDASLRHDFAERGRRRAQQFSWERTARQVIQVYRETIGDMT